MWHRSSFLLSLVLVAGVARADPDPEPEERPLPRPVRIERMLGPGVGKRSCADAEAIGHGIAAHITPYQDPFDPNAAARLTVTFTREGIKYGATVEVRDEQGVSVYNRLFTPLRQCDVLVGDIGIVVGSRFSSPAPPAPAAPAPTTPTTSTSAPSGETAKDPTVPSREATKAGALPVVRPPPANEEPKSQPPRWALRAAASGGVSRGGSPAQVEAVLNLEGGGHWRLTPDWMLSASLGMRYSPRAYAPMLAAMAEDQAEVGTSLITGALVPCLHRKIAFLWAFGCVGVEVGQLGSKATRLGNSATAKALWAAIDPRLGIEVPLISPSRPRRSQVAVRVSGELPVPILRRPVLVEDGPSMSSDKPSEVWATPPVAGSVNLGLVAWFDL
jgi:hypothetical protein